MKKNYGFKIGDTVIHNGVQTTITGIKERDGFWGFKTAQLANARGWSVALIDLYKEQESRKIK